MSHQPHENWCADGSFLVQFDQDQAPGASPLDNPIVGQAKCCRLKGLEQEKWGQCQWYAVGGIKSHNRDGTWCPVGSFLTQFDLDSVSGAAETDSPVVGQARCCTLTGTEQNQYGSTYWIEVDNSHQPSPSWAVEDNSETGWGFLTQFDLDGGSAGADYPVVGQAKFSRPVLKAAFHWPLYLQAIINGKLEKQK